MKIFLPVRQSDKPKTGKGFFCRRLGKALLEMGYQLVENSSSLHDVSLHLAKIREGGGKRILRLNGVCHNDAMNIKKRNKGQVKALRVADGVIYQSAFSKKLCDKYLGKFKGPTCIIPNGADPGFYQNITSMELKNKNNFISASRWRPHKRLHDIIAAFHSANIEDSCLYIAGDLTKSGFRGRFSDRVKYLGTIDQKTLGRYLKASKGFVHLCWFDNCPNAVIEAICAGVPVISNNVGGTPEIVDLSGGFVCPIDKPYNFKPVHLYDPPQVDRGIIAAAMRKCLAPVDISSSHVNIKTIARRYADFFEKVIHG